MHSSYTHCELCEWRCGVDRLAGTRGVCRVGSAEVAAISCSETLRSMSVTLLGCCYRCLHCNAYRISQYPDPLWWYGRRLDAAELVDEICLHLEAVKGIPVDQISFTGGDPAIHLPFIEEVAAAVRVRGLSLGIGIATGGFSTPGAMERIATICSSITIEIKAFDDCVHRALTGAPAGPVLRNAAYLAGCAPEKIRVFRTVAIPGITDRQIPAIAAYIAGINPDIPYRLIGFRPNFILYYHPGPTMEDMERLAEECRAQGLNDVAWSGYYPESMPPDIEERTTMLSPRYAGCEEAARAGAYVQSVGCPTHPRDCGACPLRHRCPATLREPWNRR
ncbi:MAG: radical SAM protein [Methanomicrobiaceae archaeon]|nr:radical SAM protein [Methanomicrobiaceae archaeon]